MEEKREKAAMPRRGEIWIVNFDPTIGSEIQKTRPALIVQNDIANRYSPTTIVAALTSAGAGNEKVYPTEVYVRATEGGLEYDSLVLLNQIRTMDKKRLLRKVGKLPNAVLERVNQAIEISFGLLEF